MRLGLLLLAGALTLQAGKYKGLWLKVSDEAAPAGGVVQVQVSLTEPKPIIRTKMRLLFDGGVVNDVLSTGIFSPLGEASGTAIRYGDSIHVEVVSPGGDWGSDEDHPILTATVRLRPDADPSAASVFRVDDASVFYTPSGAVYGIESNAPGSVRTGGTLAINEVIPSGGVVEAGQPVVLIGEGFDAGTKVEIENASPVRAVFVSPTELLVFPAEALQLDVKRISVQTAVGETKSFYSTLNSATAYESGYDLVAAMEPLFSPRIYTSASIGLPPLQDEADFHGIAVQNPNASGVTVQVRLLSDSGDPIASTVFLLLGDERLTNALDDLFPGVDLTGASKIEITGSGAVQLMGLYGNFNEGSIRPLMAFEAPVSTQYKPAP